MKTKKKIFFLSVGRSDFLRQKSILDNINKNFFFDTSLIVTASHKLNEFGQTIEDIKANKIKYYDCSIKSYSFQRGTSWKI